MSNKRKDGDKLTVDEGAAEDDLRLASMAGMLISEIERINYLVIDNELDNALDRMYPGRPINGMFDLLGRKIDNVLSHLLGSAYDKEEGLLDRGNASELRVFMSSLQDIRIEVSDMIEREEEKSLDRIHGRF